MNLQCVVFTRDVVICTEFGILEPRKIEIWPFHYFGRWLLQQLVGLLVNCTSREQLRPNSITLFWSQTGPKLIADRS